MYCKKCGKQIEGPSEICEECMSAEAPVAESIAPTAATVETAAPVAAPVAEKKANKKFAIMAMIFGIVSLYLMISMLAAIPLAKEMIINRMRDMSSSYTIVAVADAKPAGAVFIAGGVFALAFCILSMIFGILTIVNSIKDLKAGVKSVSSLVMSIVGIVLSIISFIVFFAVINGASEFIAYFEDYQIRG